MYITAQPTRTPHSQGPHTLPGNPPTGNLRCWLYTVAHEKWNSPTEGKGEGKNMKQTQVRANHFATGIKVKNQVLTIKRDTLIFTQPLEIVLIVNTI